MSKTDFTGCYAPSHELVVTSQGQVAPCCTYRGPTFHIQEALKSPSESLYQSYADLDLIFGKEAIPLGCKNCFRRESSGLISKRKKIMNRTRSLTKHLEISFSNLCNLDCVMCNSQFSSKLKSLHGQFLAAKSNFLKSHHQHYFDSAQNYGLSEIETEKLANQLRSIETIEILGGEPMLFKHLNKFFRVLLEVNPEIREIGFVTNGTVINKDLFEILNKFEKSRLIFSLSVDASGEIYRYIRGIGFSKVDAHVRELLVNPRVFRLFIKPTLGLINGGSIPELLEWVESLGENEKLKVVLDQFLDVDEPLSFGAVPISVRETWARRLKEHVLYTKYKIQIDGMIRQMMSYPHPDVHTLEGNRESIEILNQYRKMDLLKLAPDLAFLEPNGFEQADASIEVALKDWVENYLSKNSSILNGFPPCPYAKEAFLKKEVGIFQMGTFGAERALRALCEKFADLNKRVLILWCPQDGLSVETTEKLVTDMRKEYGPQNMWVMYDHPRIKEGIQNLDFSFGKGTLFFIQRLNDLVEKAGQLEKLDYYKSWDSDYFNEVFKVREEQWIRLRSPQNE